MLINLLLFQTRIYSCNDYNIKYLYRSPQIIFHFVGILEQVAAKYGCTVYKIDKWFPSSKLCDCGYKNDNLSLNERTWVCPHCGQVHDRDVHAAEMILRRGIYELTSNSKTIEPLRFEAVAFESRISSL